MNHAVALAAADLSWFLSAGLSSFERSPSGPMLERAWLFSTPGVKHRAVLTARPISETVSATREEPDHRTLIRYGRVSRRLRALAALDPLAAEALSLAFGNAGARWAAHDWKGRPRGREVALFPLVPHGVELVARVRRHELCAGCGHARSRHGERADETVQPPKVVRCCHGKDCACGGFRASLERSDADVLRVEVVVDDVTRGKDALRHALVNRAYREAAELLERSLALWVAG
jgi:hypothetical protein